MPSSFTTTCVSSPGHEVQFGLLHNLLNHFSYGHCSTNNIITIVQAGGKKGVWGCTDQLHINKMILDEVRSAPNARALMNFAYLGAYDIKSQHEFSVVYGQITVTSNSSIVHIKNVVEQASEWYRIYTGRS